MARMTIAMSTALAAQVKAAAEADHRSQSSWMQKAAMEKLEREAKP